MLALTLAVALLAGGPSPAVSHLAQTTIAAAPADPTPRVLGRAAAQSASLPSSQALATVLQAVSGDTIDVVYDDSASARIRLLGIVAPDLEGECYGVEASVRARQLLNGQRVQLEQDVVAADEFGVPLRYVLLADGALANTMLVGEGYARVAPEADVLRRGTELRAAEAQAQREARGLWLACSAG